MFKERLAADPLKKEKNMKTEMKTESALMFLRKEIRDSRYPLLAIIFMLIFCVFLLFGLSGLMRGKFWLDIAVLVLSFSLAVFCWRLEDRENMKKQKQTGKLSGLKNRYKIS